MAISLAEKATYPVVNADPAQERVCFTLYYYYYAYVEGGGRLLHAG